MSRPIVHIGYHKTGTSWFQKNFYPRVRNAGYLGRQAVRDAFLNTTAFAFDPDKAAEVLSAETDGRPIICEEDLSGHYYNGGCLESLSKDIAYRIHAVYPQAQIVIFIRNQLDMIRSTYLQYIRSGGTEGHLWRGVPTLLLRTTGRRSGRPVVLPLIYGRHGDDHVVVASKGGAPEHPAWYLNLVADPNVGVQVGTNVFAAEARVATDTERAALWPQMVGIWPAYEDYARATDREIPIVILEYRGEL